MHRTNTKYTKCIEYKMQVTNTKCIRTSTKCIEHLTITNAQDKGKDKAHRTRTGKNRTRQTNGRDEHTN